jgi:hypothetical protein
LFVKQNFAKNIGNFDLNSTFATVNNRKIFTKNDSSTTPGKWRVGRKHSRRITMSWTAAFTPDGSNWGGRWEAAWALITPLPPLTGSSLSDCYLDHDAS